MTCRADLLCLLVIVLLPCAVAAADFPQPHDTQSLAETPLTPADEAVAKIALPAGIRASLFAAEPDVQNPIALDWDRRGRLWIAENYTYAERPQRFDNSLRDRIIILDGAGTAEHFTSRTVFADDLQMLTSVAVGSGGVWALCPPRLLFIPDRDNDDRPDGEPTVMLDGFTVPEKNYHNFANGLKFGPDGWLYGRCGGSCPGELGLPGTPAAERIPLRGGMWRFHPERRVVEVLNYGTTNPWGHDWDSHGELFFTNTVNGHLFHSIVGAHYHRIHSVDPNARAYAMLEQHADHQHFDTSQNWAKSRDGAAREYGGGHAHVGAMIYQGGRWPASFDNRLFTFNMHGRCVNQERIERHGSGYVARHEPNVFTADDPWYRCMDLSFGPDGNVVMIDWCDAGECHEADGVHRTSGRVYKFLHDGGKATPPPDFASLDEAGLVEQHQARNEWFARQARLELMRRRAEGAKLAEAVSRLQSLCDSTAEPVVQLRAMWSLFALNAADEAFLRRQLKHPDEHVRVWAIRLLTDAWPLDTVVSRRPSRAEPSIAPELLDEFVALAASDSSALVRLVLASTLQRLPVGSRAAVASPLLAHQEDAEDHNLPLLIWWGLIPLADEDPVALAQLAAPCEIPPVRQYIARRLTEDIDTKPEPVDVLLQAAARRPGPFAADIVNGMTDALAGVRRARRPAAWSDAMAAISASDSAATRDRVRDLDALFGDEAAAERLRSAVLDGSQDVQERKDALQMLVRIQPSDLRGICEKLLDDPELGAVAVRGLGNDKDVRIAKVLVDRYGQLSPAARSAAVDVMAARPASARTLLAAVSAETIPRTDVTPFHVRQLRSFKDKKLDATLDATWGALRDVSTEKREKIAALKRQLTQASLASADPSAGRALFNKTCSTCHRLYGEGQTIGPDLTGAGRDNLQYLLDNILDPSAVVTADFRMSVVTTDDGRVLNGVVVASTPKTVTLQMATERVSLERSAILDQQVSPLSLMPDGLLVPLDDRQVRDLFAYLMTRQQVPLPAEAGGN